MHYQSSKVLGFFFKEDSFFRPAMLYLHLTKITFIVVIYSNVLATF